VAFSEDARFRGEETYVVVNRMVKADSKTRGRDHVGVWGRLEKSVGMRRVRSGVKIASVHGDGGLDLQPILVSALFPP